MTTKQKQWQLFFLGYYGTTVDEIDGIWGAKSMEGTEKFQAAVGIKVDGIFGVSTENKTKEIIDAVQDVVTKYSSTPLVNDGLAGPATMAATAKYQEAMGLTASGIADSKTRSTIQNIAAPSPQKTPSKGGWWDDIEFFSREEFKCKCGGRYCNGYPAEMQEAVVRIADNARKHFGARATVISGLRCRQHNANEGGVANSQHMYGEAIDLRIDGVSADRLLAFVNQQPNKRYAYKINATNVHFDIPKGAR